LLRSSERLIPQVSGTFKGDGKAANLVFVSVHNGEPLADKETIRPPCGSGRDKEF
jgi:hypothetical protein